MVTRRTKMQERRLWYRAGTLKNSRYYQDIRLTPEITGNAHPGPAYTRRVAARTLLAAGLGITAACSKKKPVLPTPPPAPTIGQPSISPPSLSIPPAPGPDARAGAVFERGLASWYGRPYHGRRAADGEIYDMETLVAAHRTLPFQTWIRVRNVSNGKTVDVRIMDRGPFIGSRIIDLSHAAAQTIELIGPGVAEVELSVITAPEPVSSGAFAVQVGAFRERANADRNVEVMRTAYGSAAIAERSGDPVLFRVLAGSEPSPEAAEVLARRIRLEQNTPQAFVVRLDQ
jgi:rare lipoprotein A